MKNLKEYVLEAFEDDKKEVEVIEAATEQKKFEFDFTDLDNAEDTINSLKENPAVSADGNIVTLTVSNEDNDNVERATEVLRQYTEVIRSSSRRASDEQYAQKTVKFAKVVSDVDNYIEELQTKTNDEKEKENKKKEEE